MRTGGRAIAKANFYKKFLKKKNFKKVRKKYFYKKNIFYKKNFEKKFFKMFLKNVFSFPKKCF